MKIEKAIEILEELKRGLDLPLMADEEDAVKLGIEALKRVEYQRTPGGVITDIRLPGETT